MRKASPASFERAVRAQPWGLFPWQRLPLVFLLHNDDRPSSEGLLWRVDHVGREALSFLNHPLPDDIDRARSVSDSNKLPSEAEVFAGVDHREEVDLFIATQEREVSVEPDADLGDDVTRDADRPPAAHEAMLVGSQLLRDADKELSLL